MVVSAASIWELEIKRSLGRLEVDGDLTDFVDQSRFTELDVSFAHARAAGNLPYLHRDPFDRMLVAQAQLEKLTIITVDKEIRRYQVEVLRP